MREYAAIPKWIQIFSFLFLFLVLGSYLWSFAFEPLAIQLQSYMAYYYYIHMCIEQNDSSLNIDIVRVGETTQQCISHHNRIQQIENKFKT